MMHELFLHPPEGELPRSFFDLQATLRETETLAPYVNEEASTPEQLIFTDPDTGVWATLAPRPPLEGDEDEGDEEEGVLLFQIPYLRPRFFGIEGALFAVALQQELGYRVEDPSAPDPAPRPRREEEMLPGWERGNRALLEELRAAGVPPAQQPKEVDADLLNRVFSHNLHRRELRLQAGQQVEVPRLFLAILPARKEPAVVCRYTAGEKLWLPDLATHVLVQRERKGWLGTKKETVRVEADELRSRLERWAVAGAPTGMRAYAPEASARDPVWMELAGAAARETALLDWNDLVDAIV